MVANLAASHWRSNSRPITSNKRRARNEVGLRTRLWDCCAAAAAAAPGPTAIRLRSALLRGLRLAPPPSELLCRRCSVRNGPAALVAPLAPSVGSAAGRSLCGACRAVTEWHASHGHWETEGPGPTFTHCIV